MGKYIERFHSGYVRLRKFLLLKPYLARKQRRYKFASILGGSEEILGDMAVKMAMKAYPSTAKL